MKEDWVEDWNMVQDGEITDVKFSPDGRMIAAGGFNKQVVVRDTEVSSHAPTR